ncbi:Vps5 C terminal like-domain-containing protein [Multifurca ochricompacta]|uniref:Vps5 C terminal like-domain-containing protein n=1 Tax=Multifurca ochricompacta TaxID=376703 RepID=A0AAD4MA57_9AGAM|nr:Vps5 C terminal like-domain-containing protein [Multifurca ochricompacta]
MSGFDDLLQQSSRALEENPFEDPFARPRSNSPDPWSTYNPQSVTLSSPAFEYDTPAFGDASTTTPTVESHHESFSPAPVNAESNSSSAPTVASDPLDSANLPEEDEPKMSPGYSEFRDRLDAISSSPAPEPSIQHITFAEPVPESVPSRIVSPPTLHSILSPRESSPPVQPSSPSSVTPPSVTPTELAEHAGPPSPPPPSSARLPQRQHAPHPSVHLPFNPSSPSSSDPHRVISTPLDQPPITSFASLALGGESFNGWDGAQSAFINNASLPSSAPKQDDVDDDDDDDKPLRPRPPETAPLEKKEIGLQPLFTITVDDPQKVGDPIRAFTMYTVYTKTTSPMFSKPSFSVLRRYSDFLWIYGTLSINNPGVVVPPVPEKSPFGRFDDQFVQQRRTALENCINKIANHPVLCKDADLRLFLESDTFSLDIKHRKAEIANERGGLMASIGHSITGPRFVEMDEWFDRQKAHLDVLETQLRGLVKAIEVVSKQRNELASAVGEFAQTVSDLAASDLGKSLSDSLEALAELERKAQETVSAQARADQATLLSTADEYARLVNSVRMAFSSRIRVYHAWQHADAELRRIKQAHERNRAQGKIATDRLGHSYSQIGEAERRALEAKQEFEHVSRLVKSEVARFEQERIEDFKKSLEHLLDGMIARQKETIQAREAFQQLLLKKIPGPGTKDSTTTSMA